MKVQCKRGIAALLAALLLFQTPVMTQVQAQTISENDVNEVEVSEEATDWEQETEETQIPNQEILNEADEDLDRQETVSQNQVEETKTVSENSIEQSLLNWVYVEKPYIKTPDTQNILVSIGNEETDIIAGSLLVEHIATKETFEMQASKEDGTAFLDSLFFSKEFAAKERGIYRLVSVSYETEKETKTIDLTNTAGIQAFFGVDEEVVTTEEQMEVTTEIVTIDENGDTVEEGSFGDAIESAKAGVKAQRSKSLYAQAGEDDEFVVVLDPGHDNTHAGARHNGLEEEDLTLKIAQYCKEELEQYSDITVYLTRTGSVCPYPGTTSTVCNSNRVAAAKKVGADIYVSMHLNSAPSASARGAEVYYPNSSYNSEIGSNGNLLASEIQKKLAEIGLNNRGIKIRNSEDNSLYPDGSLADYYGVIKNSKLNGFPGVIIEHAFLTNSSDANLLSSEEGLKKLGVADAQGIAEYYELVKDSQEEQVEFTSGNLSIVEKDVLAGTFTVSIDDVEPYDEIGKVVFKVWTKSDKSDLKSYKAKDLGDGSFEADVSCLRHNKAEGKYYVYAYVTDADGKEIFLKKKTVNMTPVFEDVTVSRKVYGNQSQYYRVVIGGMPEAQKVNIKLWYTKSGSQSAITYKAKKAASGNWYYNIPLSKMPKEGKYKMEISGTAAYGTEKKAKSLSFTYKRKATVSVTKTSNTQRKFKAKLEGMGYASKVTFQVWSKTGGKDDLKTYKGKKSSNGTWACNIPINKHKTAGRYYVVAVAKVGTDTVTLSKKGFTVTGPSAKEIKIENKDTTAMTFDVVVTGIESPAGFSKKTEIAVWCKSDKSDLKTYKAKVRKDGTSRITVNIKNHKRSLGTYKVQVSLTDNNKIKTTLKIKKVGMRQATSGDSSKYPIMGTTETNLNQMVAYYNDNADYPAYYANSDAPTITAFCKLYLSESKAEGVKAEVAFVQAMKETNFLRYGGDVDISQYNFAGLGATGGGASGATFSSVKIGIRAQVQHLKAYATTEELNNECVDPRYIYVTKGCAPYVQWLGINENPIGKGWATDPGYGNDIVERIEELKTY